MGSGTKKSCSERLGWGGADSQVDLLRKYIRNEELGNSVDPYGLPVADIFGRSARTGTAPTKVALRMPNFSEIELFSKWFKINYLVTGMRIVGSGLSMANWRKSADYPKIGYFYNY